MQMQKEKDVFYLPLWLLWGVALFCVLAGLGSYPLLNNNEGLYAEIPREMLASGDWKAWIIPHLNGLAYMEKPPLLYWLTAGSFYLFGESSWSARLIPALASLFCVAQLSWFGKKIHKPQAGHLAGLIFASSLGVIVMSRTLMFDMLLTTLLTAALMRMYLFLRHNEKGALRWALVFLALAIMTKGLVAMILFVAVTGILSVWLSQSLADFLHRCFSLLDWRAWCLFLLIVVPWHVAASVVEPIFAWFYFINEHVLRFLGKREPHDYYSGSWWYYLPRLLVFLFPWSALIPSFLLSRHRFVGERDLHVFLLLSWLMPLLFFSLSSAKANYYLVTVMPLACLQFALIWEDIEISQLWKRMLPGVMLVVAVAGLIAWRHHKQVNRSAGAVIFSFPAHTYVDIILTVMILLALVLVAVSVYRPRFAALVFASMTMFFSVAVLPVVWARTPSLSTETMAATLQKEHANATVFLYQVFEERSTLPFYLKKPVYILQGRSNDLYWGNRLHANDIYWDEQKFSELLSQKAIVILVLRRDEVDFLSKPYASKFHRAGRIGHTDLFTNE